MPPRYYLDEDVSHRIAPLVRAAGYDVLATHGWLGLTAHRFGHLWARATRPYTAGV